MPKYHILYEAELEDLNGFESYDVDDVKDNFDETLTGDDDGVVKSELIVTPIEAEPELPTTPGSVVREPGSQHWHWHPGWVLTSDGGWVSLYLPSAPYAAESVAMWYRKGAVEVIFDAGKAST